MLEKLTFGEQVNVLERYCKGDILYIYKILLTLFPKLKVLKGLISRSDLVSINLETLYFVTVDV